MSILDETRSYLLGQRTKLQDERNRLVGERDKLSSQIDEIDVLLRQLDALDGNPTRTSKRSGTRDRVLEAVKARPTGATPVDVRTALGMADKAGSQAVSNALSALKRAGKLTVNSDGVYTAAS